MSCQVCGKEYPRLKENPLGDFPDRLCKQCLNKLMDKQRDELKGIVRCKTCDKKIDMEQIRNGSAISFDKSIDFNSWNGSSYKTIWEYYCKPCWLKLLQEV
jgi:hypothetical protein